MDDNLNYQNFIDNNNNQQTFISKLEENLKKATSIYKNDRFESENYIESCLANEFQKFLKALCKIICDEKYSKEIRQLAVFVIKNKILNKNFEHTRKWLQLHQNSKNEIKTCIISTLASGNQQVRRSVSNLIATIFKTEISISQEWSETIENLVSVALNEMNEDSLIESSLETLSFIVEEVCEKNPSQVLVDRTLNCLFKNIQFSVNTNKIDRLILCLSIFYRVIPFSEKNFKKEEEKTVMMSNLFMIAENILVQVYSQNFSLNSENFKKFQLLLEICLKSFIQIGVHHYICTTNYFEEFYHLSMNVMNKYTNIDNIFISEKIVLFALETLCVIGDKEIELSNLTIDVIDVSKQSYQNNTDAYSKRFFQIYSKNLIEILTRNLIHIKSNEDSDPSNSNKFQSNLADFSESFLSDWTISKACAYLLSIVVRLSDSSSLEKLLIFAETNFHSRDYLLRYSALIALCCCLDTTHKEKISNLLKCNFEEFFKTIADKSELVANTSSWLLCKISESFPYVIEKNMMCWYIPLFAQIIKEGKDEKFFRDERKFYLDDEQEENEGGIQFEILFTKEIRINICHVLINLIKFYGDKETRKNSNALSPYCMDLLHNLLQTAINECNEKNSKDKNMNLSFFSMQVCAKIIEYSSQNLQDYLEIILNKFVELLEKSNQSLNNLEKYQLEFQENLCAVIEQIFRKIIRAVKPELSNRTFNAITTSFHLRKDVYESGIFCITALSINIKEDFISMLNVFMEYAYYSLKKYDEPLVCKSGILAITSIICSFNKLFLPYVSMTLSLLFEILKEQNLNRSVKLLAISAIGDICLNIPESISQNILSIIQILFSASEVAIKSFENIEDIDEDTADYILQLKLSLVEAFNSLIFGLRDINQTEYLNNYLSQLLLFIKLFMDIEKPSHLELLNNLICLIADIIQIYSFKEIKPFIDQDYLRKGINKIKATNNKKYMNTISWAENLINKVL